MDSTTPETLTTINANCENGEVEQRELTANEIVELRESQLPTPALRDVENARLDRVIQTADAYEPPTGQGRGIVTCAGGSYFPSAYVMIRCLRHFGCQLPVEFWYDGEREMSPDMLQIIKDLGVTPRDASAEILYREHWSHGFFEMKSHVLELSQFDNILFIDADCMPVADLTPLFDDDEFAKTGLVAWPSGTLTHKDDRIWRAIGHEGIEDSEFETGLLLFNKTKRKRTLAIANYLNDHADYYYTLVYGDANTLQVAVVLAKEEYSFMPLPDADFIPPRAEGQLPNLLYHKDRKESRIAQHMAGAVEKWQLFSNISAVFPESFQYKDLANQFLQELRNCAGEFRNVS